MPFTEAVDYKKKYFDLLKQKERAFLTKEKDWADDDSDDETEYVNLALMTIVDNKQEASSSSNQVISTNITDLSKD